MRSNLLCLATLAVIPVAGGIAPPAPFAGVWVTEGYGLAFVARGARLQAYEVTSTTCVRSFSARRLGPAEGAVVTYRRAAPDGGEGEGDVFQVIVDSAPERARLHDESTASDVLLRRVTALPRVCAPPTPNTPLGNFEVFTRTWAEQYILFDLKRTDWDTVVARYRPQVTRRTTPRELFAIFGDMIAPFEDAHTNISAPDIGEWFIGFRRGTDRILPGGILALWRDPDPFMGKHLPKITGVTDRAFLRGPLRAWCNGQLHYGRLNDSTGYLRILSFSDFDATGAFRSGLVSLEAALDTVFSDRALRALVIDVRINFGGSDPYGLAIASRLASAPYVAYTKVARADPVDRARMTPGQPSVVQPSVRPSFHGPVVELIGPLTISAGETFTQALLGRTPRVERIGENTQGVFSDVLSRRLPNGWRFGLQNEVFLTAEGTTFDGPGIPPTIPVPVFPDSDLSAGRDGALAKALELLGGGGRR